MSTTATTLKGRSRTRAECEGDRFTAAIGLGGAVAFGVLGYLLAIAALGLLPETHGRALTAVR